MSRPMRAAAPSHMVGVRLTDAERERFAAAARSLGISFSDFMRRALLELCEIIEKSPK